MEHGFFHPDRGYWQTNDDVPAEIKSEYPEGTIEVPLKPSRWCNLENGQWIEVEPDAQIVAEEIRNKRNYFLLQSDWTQLQDVPESTKEKWSVYRQALRDITDQSEFPLNVVWPVSPN